MKKFVRDFVYILILILIGIYVIEILLNNVQNEYSYKHKYLQEHKDDISILILGHSHTAWGINPHFLDSAFNAAIAARPLYYDTKLAEKWIPNMSNLKVLIISHGYDFPWGFFNLHNWEEEEWKKNTIYMHYKYMGIPFVETPNDYLLHTALFSSHLAKESFRNEELGIGTYDSLGFIWRGKAIHECDDWQENDKIHINNIGADSLYKYVQEYIMYLRDIAKICENNNVRLIAVTTPCHKSYLEQTNKIGMQTLYDVIDSVKINYPIEYYNYLSDEEFRADSFYYDCSHLNYIGAKHFTKRLKKDLGL